MSPRAPTAAASPARERLRLGLLGLALVYPTFAAWLYFVAFAQHPQMRWLYLAAKAVQALLPLVAWRALGVEAPRLLGRGGTFAGLATGVAMGAAVLAVWVVTIVVSASSLSDSAAPVNEMSMNADASLRCTKPGAPLAAR